MATIHRLSDLAVEEIAKIKAGIVAAPGLPSGLELERFCPGGVPRDKVTILFADTGTFKTTVAGHMLLTMAEQGHNVLCISFEDSARLATHRFLSQRTGVPYGTLSGGVVAGAELAAISAIDQRSLEAASRFYICDDLDPIFDRVIAAVKQVPNCAAVVVDYIQLLTDGRSQKDALDYAVVQAQLAAKTMNCAFILVSQMKVDRMDINDNPRPQLRDLFGSSAMRMGGKLTVALFRPWMHCKAPVMNKGPYAPYAKFCSAAPDNVELYPGVVEAHVLKNVLGPLGFTTLHVEPSTGLITPVDLRGYV
jgi:KaiC/GvpD/RAD55 family RecA-like ATPase